jgi:hypothetical protein
LANFAKLLTREFSYFLFLLLLLQFAYFNLNACRLRRQLFTDSTLRSMGEMTRTVTWSLCNAL